MISSHLSLELISRNACADLHEEDDAHEDGEGGGHAVVLLDRAAAAEEGDEEDDAADDDEEDRRVEELVAEEVEILRVSTLDHSSSHNQEQAGELEGKSDANKLNLILQPWCDELRKTKFIFKTELTAKRRLKRKRLYLTHLMLVSMIRKSR